VSRRPRGQTRDEKLRDERIARLPETTTETRYLVVGSGNGYTLDREGALALAADRARFTGEQAFVLGHTVTITPWAVVETVEPDVHEETGAWA
jgi:hypothetical protein